MELEGAVAGRPAGQRVLRGSRSLHGTDRYSMNPIDAETDYAGSCMRADDRLVTALALGRGATGSGPPARNPDSHVRSYAVLSKHTIQMKPIKVAARVHSACTRYLHFGRQHMAKYKRCAVACDGAKIGGRDVRIVLIMRMAGDGDECKVMRAPPRVFQRLSESVKFGFSESLNVRLREKVKSLKQNP